MMVRCFVLIASLLVAQASFAQSEPWTDLRLSGLPTLYVLDDTGRETSGTLVRLTDSSVVIRVDGVDQAFEAGLVRRIEKRGDSLKNGAIIGAVVGLVLGVLAGGMADCVDGQGGVGTCSVGSQIGIAAASTGIYAAIGTGIDAAIQGRTLLFETQGAVGLRASVPNLGGLTAREHRRLSLGLAVSW